MLAAPHTQGLRPMLIYIALTFSMLTADDEWSVQAHLLGLLHNIECFSIANVICPQMPFPKEAREKTVTRESLIEEALAEPGVR